VVKTVEGSQELNRSNNHKIKQLINAQKKSQTPDILPINDLPLKDSSIPSSRQEEYYSISDTYTFTLKSPTISEEHSYSTKEIIYMIQCTETRRRLGHVSIFLIPLIFSN
jgi:hypothetical protein